MLTINKKRQMAHRMAWLYVHGVIPTLGIDHINRVRHDNRITNLRPTTHSSNLRNRSIAANNKSGVTGVCRDRKSGKWKAQIFLDKRCICLGFFDELRAAAKARRAGELKYFGVYAPSI
jgi:hypothetical protein